MKQKFARGLIAAAAVVGIGAGTALAAAPASAAAPADLRMIGGVNCQFGAPGVPWQNAWTMTRWMTVQNVGGTTMPGVWMQEVSGQQKYIGDLKPGEVAWAQQIKTVQFGCFPASISGYTWGAYTEDLSNNFGFWYNVNSF
jgi:hypothetical protein